MKFLKDQRLAPELFDIGNTVDLFQREMAKGLTPEGSSLPMFPSFVEDRDQAIPSDQPVAVIDAGGTSLRVALISFGRDGTPEMSDFKIYGMPGVDREVKGEEFFRIVADYAAPVVRRSDYLGFCFSYPMIQKDAHDGILKNWTKEVKVPDLVGQPLAAGLREELARRNIGPSKKPVLLNDTVATLLAGKVAGGFSGASDYFGFIFGTGQNSAYLERNDRITKVKGLTPGTRQVINMESANFALAPRGPLDEAFLKTTKNPSLNRFEKMASGAYLGPLAGYILASTEAAPLFSAEGRKGLASLAPLTTCNIDHFLRDSRNLKGEEKNLLAACFGPGAEEDRVAAWFILDALLERAAKCVAVNLSAVVLWGRHGEDPTAPVRLCVNGSTFHKLKGFRPRVEYYLKDFLWEKHHRYYEIVHPERAPLLGAAVAGLLVDP